MRKYTLTMVVLILLSAGFLPQARADWRAEVGIFRVGLVTGSQSSGIFAKSEPFRASLEQALGLEVQFFAARNVELLIDALRTDRIEYAIMPATAYALAWATCECVEPVAAPRSSDGTNSYHSVLISRVEGVSKVSELNGKVIGEMAPGSIVQSGLVKELLSAEGINPEQTDFQSAGSGEATLQAFTGGEYDALIGWSSLTGITSEGYTRGTLRQMAVANNVNLSSYRVIWQSPPLPHRPHVLRKKLSGEAKQLVKNFLLSLFDSDPVAYDSIEPIYGGGFGNARHEAFKPFIQAVSVLKPADLKEEEETETPIAEPEAENPPE